MYTTLWSLDYDSHYREWYRFIKSTQQTYETMQQLRMKITRSRSYDVSESTQSYKRKLEIVVEQKKLSTR